MNMKPVLVILSLMVCLVYFWHDTAEARRFGGSRSFGSKPTYQRSAPAPAQKTSESQVNQAKTKEQAPPGVSRPFGGRFGGMVGGLLMGGLIGSLLFGGGHGFGGPGLLDLLVIGGGLFLLFRFLRARRMATQSPDSSGPVLSESASQQQWRDMSVPSGAAAEVSSPSIPPEFNSEDFLNGARAMYVRLQTAWDNRDLEDIRQFTSPEVYAEIKSQAEEDPQPGKTELLLISPQLIEVRETDDQTIATVLFDVMMREDGDSLSKQVRELWHFSRNADRPDSFWMLEGIQQVD